jgi:hypothetical protein
MPEAARPRHDETTSFLVFFLAKGDARSLVLDSGQVGVSRYDPRRAGGGGRAGGKPARSRLVLHGGEAERYLSMPPVGLGGPVVPSRPGEPRTLLVEEGRGPAELIRWLREVASDPIHRAALAETGASSIDDVAFLLVEDAVPAVLAGAAG